jgi:hypothetical protein
MVSSRLIALMTGLVCMIGIAGAAFAADDAAPLDAGKIVAPAPPAPADAADDVQPEPTTPADVTDEMPAPNDAQTGVNDPRRQAPPVAFENVDYKDAGPDTGKISLSGKAQAGARLLIYFDQDEIGRVVVAPDGTWSLEVDRKLDTERHTFSALSLDGTTGAVLGRATMDIARKP